MRKYFFKIELLGYGETPLEAWEDAVEHFALDPGPPPETYGEEDEEIN